LDRYDDEDANVIDDVGSMAPHSPSNRHEPRLLVPDHREHVRGGGRDFGSDGGSFPAESNRTARFGAIPLWLAPSKSASAEYRPKL
jgi:hypothetical protein